MFLGVLLLLGECTALAFNTSDVSPRDAWTLRYPLGSPTCGGSARSQPARRSSAKSRWRSARVGSPRPPCTGCGRGHRCCGCYRRLAGGRQRSARRVCTGSVCGIPGVSWCAGGEGTWREYLTLPNILKVYNPRLRGYSTGTGEWLQRNARMNVAFPVASDQDALKQAKILVARMFAAPDIDVARHWKLVTIFLGANDLCSASCLSPVEWSPLAHARKLARALDYLHANLPRTIVNLVPVLDVSVSVRVRRPAMCRLMHPLFCTCFHRGGGELRALVAMTRLYQKAETMLVDSGRYDSRPDFTVVLQPFMRLFNAPWPPSANLPLVIHQSYITHDCFHFSQKGHALAANLLWNNLLEPVGNKTDDAEPVLLRSFRCPSREAPFIFTHNNTRTYLATGRQEGYDDL